MVSKYQSCAFSHVLYGLEATGYIYVNKEKLQNTGYFVRDSSLYCC